MFSIVTISGSNSLVVDEMRAEKANKPI